MDWKRFGDPSFVAAALCCVLVIVQPTWRPKSPSPNLPSVSGGSVVESPSQLKEFDEAISAAESHLQKGDFAPAIDLVMVASRLAPSEPRLFDLVIRFIEKAKTNDDEEFVAMAEDLLDRGDSLVHFQSPHNVASSRKRLTEVRQSFLKPITPVNPQPLLNQSVS